MKRMILIFTAVSLFAQEKPEKPLKGSAAYASELAKLTGTYLKEVEKKIDAEEDAYQQASRLYASAHQQGIFESLAFDREGKAIRFAAQMEEGRLSVADFLFRELPAYADSDFRQTRVLFDQEIDTEQAFLRSLVDIQADSKKIAGLQSLFEDLSKKPSLTDWSKQLLTFGQELDRQTKASDCALSVSRLKFLEAESARLGGLVEQARVPGEKARLEAEKKALDQNVTDVKGRRDASGLFNAATKSCKGA